VLERELSPPIAQAPVARDLDSGPNAVGVRQNARLTALLGSVLVILLGAELATALSVDSLIGPHLILGTALLAPVALKLGTTGWKIVRYYAHAPAYVRAGAPHLFRRLLAPVVIVTTVGLLGSGLALLVLGPAGAGHVATFHRGFFAVWCVALAMHVLTQAVRSLRAVRAEVTATGGSSLPGRRQRALALCVTLVVGIGLAAWAAQQVAPWTIALHG
jgi:hypothetical protein